jgi:hypothetical protein
MFALQQRSMGQPLVLPDALPDHLYALLSGELRQLVSWPAAGSRHITLALHQPPFLAGWASLQAEQATGSSCWCNTHNCASN